MLDGKLVKEVMGVVSMVDCETGAPVAVAASRRKEGTVGECEFPKGRKLIRGQDLTNALVCADALHGQQETARDILDANGDCLLQIKGNQATVLRNAENIVKAHARLDALFDRASGRTFATDADRVAHLFNLYAEKVSGQRSDSCSL